MTAAPGFIDAHNDPRYHQQWQLFRQLPDERPHVDEHIHRHTRLVVLVVLNLLVDNRYEVEMAINLSVRLKLLVFYTRARTEHARTGARTGTLTS